jgi:protein gp37
MKHFQNSKKMANSTKIQWTDATWNIARGCSKVDADCAYCYMFRQSLNATRYQPNQVIRTKTVFNDPLKLKVPSKIFTSSLTDFFHPAIDSYRHEAWEIIRKCPQHTFQILTKRPERIHDHLPPFWEEIRNHVWLGTSIGSEKGMHRLYDLILPINPGVKFLSLEPLHGRIDLPFNDFLDFGHKVKDLIDWVIIGGESGNELGKSRYRPCEVEWFEHLISQCIAFEIPVFVKQLGTHLAKHFNLKDRHGGDFDEWPDELAHLKVRKFPHYYSKLSSTP